MHANRNSRAVKRVSRGIFKANRARNFFAVSAIILTTFMITSVFSLGMSYKENYDTLMIRSAGTTAEISLPGASDSQYERIKSLDYVDSVGRQLYAGNLVRESGSGSKVEVPVMCFDEEAWEQQITPAVSDIHGSYPQKADQVMISEATLKQMGVDDPYVGMKISFAFENADGTRQGEYILSGWFKGYSANTGNLILFSEKFCEDNGITLEKNGMVSIQADDPSESLDMLEKDVELAQGQEFQSYFAEPDLSDTVMAVALI